MSRKASPFLSNPINPRWTNAKVLGVLLGLFAALLYANTIGHDYVLDDEIVITSNSYTQEGLDGLPGIFTSDPINVYFGEEKNLVQGGRYRPLSIATFAMEEEFSHQNPALSHLINALLYGGAVCLLFFLLVTLRPPPAQRPFFATSAFLIALLFAVHPIHTEVVANIKGRDELLALLLGLATFYTAIRYYDTRRLHFLVLLPVWFFLALLAKESALPLLLPIPLAVWFFRKFNWRPTLGIAAVLLMTTVLYLTLRISLVGPPGGAESAELLNNPFIGMGFGERLAVAFHALAVYLEKLAVPYPLSHDYYPWAIPQTGWGDAGAWMGLLLYGGLFAGAIWGFFKKNPIAFGIIWYLSTISIVSNIPFTVGTLMGERLAFIPSLGFCMAVVWGLEAVTKKIPARGPAIGLLAVSLLFAGMTLARNMVWQDNFTLFTTDVYHVPGSAKAHNSAGGALNDRANELPPGPEQTRLYQESERLLQRAVQIYPQYAQAYLLLGNARNGLNRPADALAAYQKALAIKPRFEDAVNNAAVVAGASERYQESAGYYRQLVSYRPRDPEVWFSRGLNFERAGQPDSAIFAYEGALRVAPDHWRSMGNLSLVYGRMKNDLVNAVRYGEMALAIHPNEEWLFDNTAIAYAMGGNPGQALVVFQRGIERFPNSAKLHLNTGMTYLNLGQRAEAIPFLQRAAELNPALGAQVQAVLGQ